MLVAALAVAVPVAVIVFSMPRQTSSDAPNVKFAGFNSDRRDINVEEFTRILFNVQNLEMLPITEAQVVIVIEPSSYQCKIRQSVFQTCIEETHTQAEGKL
jgi:hypothetical protein